MIVVADTGPVNYLVLLETPRPPNKSMVCRFKTDLVNVLDPFEPAPDW